jgi:xanthine/uracil/vitamin C permease (AzgA family)
VFEYLRLRFNNGTHAFNALTSAAGTVLIAGVNLFALALVVHLFGTHEIKVKASGINIDLWTGLGMLVVAALMLTWALLRPLVPAAPQKRGATSPARGVLRPADA